MAIPNNLLDVSEYNGAGYQPLVDYESWQAARLRYEDEFLS